jgi:hypothetical protein
VGRSRMTVALEVVAAMATGDTLRMIGLLQDPVWKGG